MDSMDMMVGSANSSNSHSMDMGHMTFSVSFPTSLVINGWSIVTNLDLILSLLGLLIFTIFFESITRITKHTSVRTLCYMAKKNMNHLTSTLRNGFYEQVAIPEGLKRTLSIQLSTNRWDVLNVPTSEAKKVLVALKWSQRFQYRMFVSCVHMGQMVVAYFIMLSVMTMNIHIISTVIIGSGIGYFFFGGMVKPDQHNKTLLFRRRLLTTVDTADRYHGDMIGEEQVTRLTEQETETTSNHGESNV
ncbi:uncharacterized protein [Antedon mediterranea]|uniref:uncharacterized protein n=1 Tax=Antedon mediterranea TaxID=105859 RepID=UPI003AF46F54